MASVLNSICNAVFKHQRVYQSGLTRPMARQGLLKYVESALVQLALFKQGRHIHSVCSACCRTKLPSPGSVVPRRYLRKLYPAIVDPTMIDQKQPDENMKLQLDYTPVLGNKGPELVEKIENVCVNNDLGRLFAVIYVNKEQRKVTTEDLVVINGFFPPQIGDRIRLEKVLMVGSKDFTLTGTPLLSKSLVKVEATVIEKSLSHIRVHFEKVKKFQRFKLLQNPQTVIVINSIELDPFALQNRQNNLIRDSSTS